MNNDYLHATPGCEFLPLPHARTRFPTLALIFEWIGCSLRRTPTFLHLMIFFIPSTLFHLKIFLIPYTSFHLKIFLIPYASFHLMIYSIYALVCLIAIWGIGIQRTQQHTPYLHESKLHYRFGAFLRSPCVHGFDLDSQSPPESNKHNCPTPTTKYNQEASGVMSKKGKGGSSSGPNEVCWPAFIVFFDT